MVRKRVWMWVVFSCLMIFTINAKVGRVEAWGVEKWDMEKKYTVSQGEFRFYAYLSKDKKEAWIYFVETVSKAFGESYEYPRKVTGSKAEQAPSELHFPQRIENAKVTKIGADMTFVPEDELDFYQNVFGKWVEYAHGGDGYCNAVRNVKTMTLPRTLVEVGQSAFSGMRKLTKVDIPDAVKVLEHECFYGCEKLREIKLPKSLSLVQWSCFERCPQLVKVTLPKSNRDFTVCQGALLSKDKRQLVWVFSGRKDIKIPDTVNTIETYAFSNSQVAEVQLGKNIVNLEEHCLEGKKLMNVTVDKNNSVYGRDGQCIYRKWDRALAVGIAVKKKLVISSRIKKLPRKASLCGELLEDSSNYLESLDIPSSVTQMHAFCPVVSVSTRVYYRGKKPPTVTGVKDAIAPLPIFCEVYVPSTALATYKKWYKSFYLLSAIEKKDWHTF